MKIGKFELDETELTYDFARSGGPGGQNVNKVNSKVVLKWNIDSKIWEVEPEAKERFKKKFKNRIAKTGEVVIHSQESRNQRDNKKKCLEKLKEMILEIEPTPVARKPIKISLTARQKRREQRVIAHRLKQQRVKSKRLERKDWDESR